MAPLWDTDHGEGGREGGAGQYHVQLVPPALSPAVFHGLSWGGVGEGSVKRRDAGSGAAGSGACALIRVFLRRWPVQEGDCCGRPELPAADS